MRVIFVGGVGRCGSTALGAALGAAPDAAYVGELMWLGRDLEEDRQCTCGQAASRCPVWGHVSVRLLAEGWRPGMSTGKHLPALLAALSERTEANVLVDSSKRLSMAFRLRAVAPTTFLWIRRAWADGQWVLRREGRVEQAGFNRWTGAVWFARRRLEVDLAARLLPGCELTHAALLEHPDDTLALARRTCGLTGMGGLDLAFPHVLTANRCRFLDGGRLGEIPFQ